MTEHIDQLAHLAGPDTQRQAARLVQEAFSRVFRLTLEAPAAERGSGIDEVLQGLLQWAAMAGKDESLCRKALLLAGLDQWGLAYSEVFGAAVLVGLSELVGSLRARLDAVEEARCQKFLECIHAVEENAFDLKVDLRREIHLAIWHATIGMASREEALAMTAQLAAMMLALQKNMPGQGWKLLADTLAHIQIRCVAHGLAADGVAQEATQGLFALLIDGLPKAEADRIMAHSALALREWQQAKRASLH